jgi:hypothetical protein
MSTHPQPPPPDDEPDDILPALVTQPPVVVAPDERPDGATLSDRIDAPKDLRGHDIPPDEPMAAMPPAGAQPWLIPPDPRSDGGRADAAYPSRPARQRRPRRTADPDGAPAAEQLRLF